jgi:hypothetical protein
MCNALAPSVTAVGPSWSRSQEWLLCARVLWNRLHSTQPDRATPRDGSVARQKCALLQINGLLGNLQQSERMGGDSRLDKD